MYEKHFNLNERPFRNIPDTRMFFSGGGRGEVLSALQYAITSGEGIIKVVGEVGSGKTMLCRKLHETLTGDIDVVFLENPSLEPEYILHAVARELHLPVSIGDNRYSVQQILRNYLLKQHAAGKRVVVLIEEAQCMPPRTLEEIRLMSNLETEHQKLLQLVLFGQPELDTLLARKSLRQLSERISYSLDLEPFSFDVLRDYLNHRLRMAGCPTQDLFDLRVVKHIYMFARGSVRRINLLADKTLLAAYAYNDQIITIKHARSAAEDCQYIDRVSTGMQLKIAIPLGVFIVIAMVVWLLPRLDSQAIDIQPVVDVVSVEKESRRAIGVKKSVANKSMVEQRVSETKEWLKEAKQTEYTIQIMTSFVNSPSELYDLERILSLVANPEDVSDYLVFQGEVNGQSVYIVCYQTYPNLSPARNAISSLPMMLKRYQPFVRTVNSIMREIGDNNA